MGFLFLGLEEDQLMHFKSRTSRKLGKICFLLNNKSPKQLEEMINFRVKFKISNFKTNILRKSLKSSHPHLVQRNSW